MDYTLTHDKISSILRYPCDLRVFDVVESTNTMAGEMDAGTLPLVLIADSQTAGRGRLGRGFSSPPGVGIYMTISLRPSFQLDKSLYVTMAAAVAVCRAIEKTTGVKGQIKWVNDIFYQGRKVCGILTEAQTNRATGELDKLIIGIGVNCFPGSFPEELKAVAGPISAVTGSFSRECLAGEIINEMLDMLHDLNPAVFLQEYRSKCFILGKNIYIHPNLDKKAIPAQAIDIDEYGGLVVKYTEGEKAGQTDTLSTGEISIRLQP